MAEIITDDDLAVWLPDFLYELTLDSLTLSPVAVLNPTDGYQSHHHSLCASAMRLGAKLSIYVDHSGNHEVAGNAKGLLTTVDRLMTPGIEIAVSD